MKSLRKACGEYTFVANTGELPRYQKKEGGDEGGWRAPECFRQLAALERCSKESSDGRWPHLLTMASVHMSWKCYSSASENYEASCKHREEEAARIAQEKAEAAARKEEAKRKRLEEERRAREVFVLMCKRQWAKGLKKRADDAMAVKEGEKIKRAKRERRRRESVRIMSELRSKRESGFQSPWEACRGGASVERLKQLISDEEERRLHQEGRAFSFDAIDQDLGETMLQLACWNDRVEIASYLVDQGASINSPSSVVTRTYPIHTAARKGAIKIVRMLVERGADIHVQDMFGDTPLHIACRGTWTGRGNISKLLVHELLRPNSEATTPSGEEWPQSCQKGMTSFWRMIGARNNRGHLAWENAPCSLLYTTHFHFLSHQLPRRQEEEEERRLEEAALNEEPEQDVFSQLAPLRELAKRTGSKMGKRKGKKKKKKKSGG